MGLFDLLKSSEPVKKRTTSRPSTEKGEKALHTSPSQKQETTKLEKKPLKVTDSVELARHLKLKKPVPDAEAVFYCPIRSAKIYCHSVLIDKLGDLTKFIISSLYTGHSVEEIDKLTQMGSTTLKEELEYLIRGGLIKEEGDTLTDLGNEYGKLLEIFDGLSDGIEMAFNVFTDSFEPIEYEHYTDRPSQQCVLKGHFIPALTRNDNYANSLKIAREQILSDTPFCWEIKSSLYTTVKIERNETYFKVVYIRDFDRGFSYESDRCVKIAIPYDRIKYRPRYTWVDQYREVLSQVSYVEEKSADLLSDKAQELIRKFKEEAEAASLTKEINTLSGTIDRTRDDLVELSDTGDAFAFEREPVELILSEESCEGLYLEEVQREQLYRILYYPYNRMEV